MSSSQPTLFPVLNQGLFSSNFLDTKFTALQMWGDTALTDRIARAMAATQTAYEAAQRAGVFESKDEQKTEDKFIRPVLTSKLKTLPLH